MLKKGKEEIIYLLNKAIHKFQLETGREIVQNTNRKNYEGLAILLSNISNQLPNTANQLGHIVYERDVQKNDCEYPFRKYDITGGQIKDALMGLVSNPRPFLIDTCYIYLYNTGRLAFEANPVDPNLIASENAPSITKDSYSIISENQQLKLRIAGLQNEKAAQPHKKYTYPQVILMLVAALSLIGAVVLWRLYSDATLKWNTIKDDFNLIPYTVTKTEVDSIEGVWLCYTGSPQARPSDPNRYHKVVTNLVEIKYKNGYFTYNRYGASFDHIGYLQFEAPDLVSIHSRIKNNDNKVESPRHSLLSLEKTGPYLSAISASWNFDAGGNNKIIGIREVYTKLGKGGSIEEVINTVENASCQCKIIRWKKTNKEVDTFFLKNISLDSLKQPELMNLIDEKSILLKNPKDGLIINN